MKGDELRARRNFHVSKRITSRLERQYGITLDHPTARETVTPIIDSLRTLRNDAKRGVNSSPPVERPTTGIPRATLENRKAYLSSLNCIGTDAITGSIPDKYESWLTDDYLFLQIGPVASGSQTKKSQLKHPECDEPECGTQGWRCDLCQEVGLEYEPMAHEEAEVPSLSSAHAITPPASDIEEDHQRAQQPTNEQTSFKHFLGICPIVSSIRRFRLEKSQRSDFFFEPSLFEEPPSFYHQHVAMASKLQTVDSTSPVPVVPEQFDECLFTLAVVLLYLDPTPSQTPGFYMAEQPISVTRGQNFVFDRGKICPCVPWFTGVHAIAVT